MSDRHTMRRTRGDAVTIRRARPADATALLQLAALDEAEPLDGDVIVAEVDGELWAAIGARRRARDQRPVPSRRRGTRAARAARGDARPLRARASVARRARAVTSLLRER